VSKNVIKSLEVFYQVGDTKLKTKATLFDDGIISLSQEDEGDTDGHEILIYPAELEAIKQLLKNA